MRIPYIHPHPDDESFGPARHVEAAATGTRGAPATFQETMEKSGVREQISGRAVFEIFQEDHDPSLADLFEKLD